MGGSASSRSARNAFAGKGKQADGDGKGVDPAENEPVPSLKDGRASSSQHGSRQGSVLNTPPARAGSAGARGGLPEDGGRTPQGRDMDTIQESAKDCTRQTDQDPRGHSTRRRKAKKDRLSRRSPRSPDSGDRGTREEENDLKS